MNTTSNFSDNLISDLLEEVLNSKKDRAILRSSINYSVRAYPYISKHIDLNNDLYCSSACAIAAFIAYNPKISNDWNFGKTMKKISNILVAKGFSKNSIDITFRQIIDSRNNKRLLIKRIFDIIIFAKRENIGVNYKSLFWDLVNWNNKKNYEKSTVQEMWAKEYYN